MGVAAEAIAAVRPAAWWRMDEMAAPHAIDSSPHHHDAVYEPGVVFFLAGPRSDAFCLMFETNRAAHFAGGRLTARLPELNDHYSVSLWIWNGMPNDGRSTAGWMMSRDNNHGLSPHGDHLGIGGTATVPGKLIFQHGDSTGLHHPLIGKTTIDRWTWNHVVLIREGTTIRVYLNGNAAPEIQQDSVPVSPEELKQFYFGGRSDNADNWEGRLDEIAVFDRALTPDEVRKLSARQE